MNTSEPPGESGPTLDELVQSNPIYRDTPLGQGDVQRIPLRPRIPARIGRPRRFPWTWLGLPEPRAVVRALMIDGYPRDLRRWAYERMESALFLLSFTAGMAVASMVAWFAARMQWPPAGVLLPVLGVAILPALVALARLLPIFNAIRYARRWRRHAGSRP